MKRRFLIAAIIAVTVVLADTLILFSKEEVPVKAFTNNNLIFNTREEERTVVRLDESLADEEPIHEFVEEVTAPIAVSDSIMIGDSNTVRMSMYGTDILKFKHIASVVGAGVANWQTYVNSGNTTGGKAIKTFLDSLEDNEFTQVVIMLGTNDFYSNEKSLSIGYQSLIDYIYSRNEDVRIVFVTIPPVRETNSGNIKNKDVNKVNSVVTGLANDKIVVIDLNSYLTIDDMSTSKSDGYHFSKAGAAKAASFIVGSIEGRAE